MTKLARFIPALLALLIVGCASLGVPEADTFNKRIVVANSLVESAVATVDALYTAGKINRDEAIDARSKAQDARTAIEAARVIYKTDPTDADNRLATITVALNVLLSVLEAKQ